MVMEARDAERVATLHAERQTSESNFRVETDTRCFEPSPVG
jgi:hypothetical protein